MNMWLVLCMLAIMLSKTQTHTVFEFSNELYYKINSYYGSRYKEFFSYNAILYGNSSEVMWPTMYDYDSTNKAIYFADPNDHTIKKINEADNSISLVAGKLNTPGFRDGDQFNSRFNKPFNLKFYQPDLKAVLKANNIKTIIINTDSVFCQQNADSLTPQNYQQCEVKDTSNLIYKQSQVKEIQMKTPSELLEEYNTVIKEKKEKDHIFFTESVLFVADTGNSCIRIIYLEQGITKTWAGVCTSNGFKDGILLYNRFQSPESVGADVHGNLMIYDSQSDYTRFVDAATTMVYTLVNGACRLHNTHSSLSLSSKALKINSVICYKNWIKTSGLPMTHIYENPYKDNTCYGHTFDCIIKQTGRQVEIINFESSQ